MSISAGTATLYLDQGDVYKAILSNETEGVLRGPITTISGSPKGQIQLSQRSDEQRRIIWEGSIILDSETMMIRLSRDEDALDNGVKPKANPLSVLKDFTRVVTYIPMDLFLTATPKFESLPEGIDLLKKTFPYFAGNDEANVLLGTLRIDYEKTNIRTIPSILKMLKMSNLFVSVDVGIAEYGGVPEQIVFNTDISTPDKLFTNIDNTANRVMGNFVCIKECKSAELSSHSSNVRIYEIVGKSENMFLKKPNTWEKYKVTIIMYTTYDSHKRKRIALLFQLTSGWRAAMRGNQQPPIERFEENTIPDETLNSITSMLMRAIAKGMNATYQEEI
jgi:hypothetical protein